MENEKLDSQLTTQTESGQRLTVIPAVVKGHWHKRRFYFQWVLLFIFLAIPWIEINDKPLLLFNVADRRFILFGLDLWATDAPLVFFVFAYSPSDYSLQPPYGVEFGVDGPVPKPYLLNEFLDR